MLAIVGGSPENWGLIPSFLNEDDPRSAKEQIHSHYMGGWNAFQGFTFDPEKFTLKYPGDPLLEPLSALLFRNETLLIYQSAWVVILQKDGSWEVARLD